MKKTLLIFLSLIGLNSVAQDKIYLKSGEKIEAKIIKVTEEKIEYKKFNNQNGPTFEISVDKIQLVVYENGESQILQNSKSDENNISESKTKNENCQSRINIDLASISKNGPASISYEILNKSGSRGIEIPISYHYNLFNSDKTNSGYTIGLNLKYYVNKKGKGFYFGPSLGLGVFSWIRTGYSSSWNGISINNYVYTYNENKFSVYVGPKVGGQFQVSKLIGINLAANGGLITNLKDNDFGASVNLGINFNF